jgi:hypothetical protein
MPIFTATSMTARKIASKEKYKRWCCDGTQKLNPRPAISKNMPRNIEPGRSGLATKLGSTLKVAKRQKPPNAVERILTKAISSGLA